MRRSLTTDQPHDYCCFCRISLLLNARPYFYCCWISLLLDAQLLLSSLSIWLYIVVQQFVPPLALTLIGASCCLLLCLLYVRENGNRSAVRQTT